MGTIPAHLYVVLIVKSLVVLFTQHAVTGASSGVRIFLCLLEVEEGRVSTNEALWYETD